MWQDGRFGNPRKQRQPSQGPNTPRHLMHKALAPGSKLVSTSPLKEIRLQRHPPSSVLAHGKIYGGEHHKPRTCPLWLCLSLDCAELMSCVFKDVLAWLSCVLSALNCVEDRFRFLGLRSQTSFCSHNTGNERTAPEGASVRIRPKRTGREKYCPRVPFISSPQSRNLQPDEKVIFHFLL